MFTGVELLHTKRMFTGVELLHTDRKCLQELLHRERMFTRATPQRENIYRSRVIPQRRILLEESCKKN